MSAMRSGKPGCVVYVGDLPSDVREREVEDLFYKYGRIRHIDLKVSSRPPAFAFVEYEDPRDAHDAVRGRDNYEFDGKRLRVEVAKGAQGPPSAPPNWKNKGTGFRILVEDLPKSASWQDLKDMFRKVAPPVYTNVYRDGSGVFGVVEYNSHAEVKDVMHQLRDARFKNPWEETKVHLVDDVDRDLRDKRSRSRSRSRSPRAAAPRSRSRSPKVAPRSASPGPRSRSPAPKRSPSPRRSRSP